MKDELISRQAAINAVNTALFPKINTAKEAEKALNALPSAQPEPTLEQIEEYCKKRCLAIVDNALLAKYASAQPERLTDDDFETIRIHLNAYKEKLCNMRRWEEAEEYQRIIDRLTAWMPLPEPYKADKEGET